MEDSLIQKLDHSDFAQSQRIWQVFQSSYRIEADLIGVEDFPPLNRTVSDLMSSPTEFYGFFKDNSLAGVIEIAPNSPLEICSLVVHPDYFRQGVARHLMDFTLDRWNAVAMEVETATANAPAIALYQNKGFKEQERWMTSFQIEKIKLRKESKI